MIPILTSAAFLVLLMLLTAAIATFVHRHIYGQAGPATPDSNRDLRAHRVVRIALMSWVTILALMFAAGFLGGGRSFIVSVFFLSTFAAIATLLGCARDYGAEV